MSAWNSNICFGIFLIRIKSVELVHRINTEPMAHTTHNHVNLKFAFSVKL